jgi:hypothetical protein
MPGTYSWRTERTLRPDRARDSAMPRSEPRSFRHWPASAAREQSHLHPSSRKHKHCSLPTDDLLRSPCGGPAAVRCTFHRPLHPPLATTERTDAPKEAASRTRRPQVENLTAIFWRIEHWVNGTPPMPRVHAASTAHYEALMCSIRYPQEQIPVQVSIGNIGKPLRLSKIG